MDTEKPTRLIHLNVSVKGARSLVVDEFETSDWGVSFKGREVRETPGPEGYVQLDRARLVEAVVPWHAVRSLNWWAEAAPEAPDETKGEDGLTDDERRQAKAEAREEESSPGTSTERSSQTSEQTSRPSETQSPSPARTTEPRSTPARTADRSARGTGGGRPAGS